MDDQNPDKSRLSENAGCCQRAVVLLHDAFLQIHYVLMTPGF